MTKSKTTGKYRTAQHKLLTGIICYSYDDMPHFRASLPPGDTPNLCCYSNYSHRGAGLPVAEPSTT